MTNGGTPTTRRTVQSISRAFDILEALAAAGQAIGITEIAERVDLPLPTIHRILHTLMETGYVFQNPRRLYALGARLIPLSRYAGGALGVTLRPYLTDVVDTVGESASVAMLDQDFARYIAHLPAEHGVHLFTEIGNQVSLYATGVGKAILASLPEEDAIAILNRSGFRAFTPTTITTVEDMLRELDEVRRLGYALDREEHEVGVVCVAVPIPGPLQLALSVSGPTTRITADRLPGVAEVLLAAARRISPAIERAMEAR